MSKLKPGDKVKVREDLKTDRVYGNYNFTTDMKNFNGKVVTISEVTDFGNYKIAEDTEGYIWTEQMFEPVPSFGKHLLRDGVIVKRKNDTYAIVIGNSMHSKKGFINLSDYDDDLKNKIDPSEFDIMAIYTPDGSGSIRDIINGEYLELIAERPEVKEMTLEQICKELGYNVKIVKEA